MTFLAPLLLFAGLLGALLLGYPVALTLAGVSLLAAGLGSLLGVFDPVFLQAFPNRIFGLMQNQTLVAIPAFVFMGAMLERSRLAEDLLLSMEQLLGQQRSGLPIAVMLVGALLAASTGIVGATVVTMGLLAMPSMLQRGYTPSIASGTICAAGTLGQIIPPSIALVLLADVLSNANQQAQLSQGIFSPETVSVGDLFAGALVPGLTLVILYCIYIYSHGLRNPRSVEQQTSVDAPGTKQLLILLGMPVTLILLVLGSILFGVASPTEAAAVGAVGAIVMAAVRGKLSLPVLRDTIYRTAQTTSMVFLILIGAALFSLVFRGYGGDEVVRSALAGLPGGVFTAMVMVMIIVFFLGFILDFIEITYVVVPIIAPALLTMGVSPVWLGVMLAINLQTSFLTPPFGFALFYLRGVVGDGLKTHDLYRGVMPFIVIQILLLVLVALLPIMATGLPGLF